MESESFRKIKKAIMSESTPSNFGNSGHSYEEENSFFFVGDIQPFSIKCSRTSFHQYTSHVFDDISYLRDKHVFENFVLKKLQIAHSSNELVNVLTP